MLKLIFAILCFFPLASYGRILDLQAHLNNQKIISTIIEQRLQNGDARKELFLEIHAIGQEALQKGLQLDIYTYDVHPATGELAYASATLWEGKTREQVTFFIFIWPSEEIALKYAPFSHMYKTVIHSHPIPCAFTVLQGELNQNCFEHIGAQKVKLTRTVNFQSGESEIDLNESCFIHQLVSQKKSSQPAMTLHAYGGSSELEVSKLFNQFESNHTYYLTNQTLNY